MRTGMSVIINNVWHLIVYRRESLKKQVYVLMPECNNMDMMSYAVAENLRENNKGGYSWDRVYYTNDIDIACDECNRWAASAA